MPGGDDESDTNVQGQDYVEDAAHYFHNSQKMFVPASHEKKKHEKIDYITFYNRLHFPLRFATYSGVSLR